MRMPFNSTSVRSTGGLALLDDQIRHVAPSIFATEAHDSRSSRYTYIPTSALLDGLRKEGFAPVMASQARSRDEGKREHTKHMLRLRHVGAMGRELAKGDAIPEIVLVNSHDGSSSYQLYAGMFRLVCTNGLMVSESQVGSIKVPHVGKVQDRVIQSAFEILDGFTRVIEAKEEMQAATLTDEEQQIFANSALMIRYADQETPAGAFPITESQVLAPRRFEDRRPDLWTTFNRVQENMIKGGLRSRTAAGRRSSTREVKSIDQDVKLNRALWSLTERMLNIKAGRPVEPAPIEAMDLETA